MTPDKEALLAKTTTGLAGLGLTMPAWWPTLEQTSNWAAQLVPILSAIWIALQIIFFIRRRRRER